MTGQDYLEDIRANLNDGRHQHRMGENLLRAFGYVRRRATALEEINGTLDKLGVATDPPINADMPLRTPRIRFSLKAKDETSPTSQVLVQDKPDLKEPSPSLKEVESDDRSLPEPSFSISELRTAKTAVMCIAPNASLESAYITMILHKFSQLVVAGTSTPRQQDIKGIVSFQSMTRALMNGNPSTVRECTDEDVRFASIHDDLKSVVHQLSEGGVVLVVGRDRRLQGIVTAWDLAEEFSGLVDPFKKIGEIEERLRTLISIRIGEDKTAQFLTDHGHSDEHPMEDLEQLSMGDLQRVLEFPEHWNALNLAFDRVVFTEALAEVRGYRNRLMHFRDPLKEAEMARLTNFCDAVREIEL